MKPGPLNLFSTLSILLLAAFSQSIAQTPQRDIRPRTASISGRVTIAEKPAAHAVITVVEIDLNPGAAGGLGPPIPFKARTRTDGDGRYLVSGLAEGRYFVSAALKAFVAADRSANPGLGRAVNLDEGEAREKVDFALVRGGVITGKVIDDEGAPLIARRVRLYTVDEQGQKRDYRDLTYEMFETDDRGVYRIYGAPPGRYIISAGGELGGDPLSLAYIRGKFPRTYHPDTTDENQARIIEIKEGSEVTDVDIRFGSARKTYEAAGRVVDRDTGNPVPRINVRCRTKPEKDGGARLSTETTADGQGNFRLLGLLPGRYQIMAMDVLNETGYTGDAAEFEITDNNVSGVEVKVFLGASVSGVVVIEGGDATSGNRLQSMSVSAIVSQSGMAMGRLSVPQFFTPARVNADGSFAIRGLPAGSVGFRLTRLGDAPPIKRIERDGVEIKDAIEVKPGEKITGVRIVVDQARGRIRGQVQIAGGAMPDWRRLVAVATRIAPANESKATDRTPVAIYRTIWSSLIDEKGRFVIEGLPVGEYDLSINLLMVTPDGDRELAKPPWSNQRVTVSDNAETSVTITIDMNRINQPQQQEGRR